MASQDLDDEPVDYRTGRGCRRPATGPVHAAYIATGALRRACTQCGAAPHQYCRRTDGTERIAPCQPRTKETRQ